MDCFILFLKYSLYLLFSPSLEIRERTDVSALFPMANLPLKMPWIRKTLLSSVPPPQWPSSQVIVFKSQ